MRASSGLNDSTVVQFVKRGPESHSLTIYQEDLLDLEAGGYQPSKSLTLTDLTTIRALRDFLNGLEIGEGS